MRKISLMSLLLLCEWTIGLRPVSAASAPACFSVAGDATQVASVRAQIASQCPCANFDGSDGKKKGDYGKCIATVLDLAAFSNSLSPTCAKRIKKAYKYSICGRDPATHSTVCVTTGVKSGKISCKIVATTKADGTPRNACTNSSSRSAVPCASADSCAQAADWNSDLVVDALDIGGCIVPTPTPVATATATQTPPAAELAECCTFRANTASCVYGDDECVCDSVVYSCVHPPG